MPSLASFDLHHPDGLRIEMRAKALSVRRVVAIDDQRIGRRPLLRKDVAKLAHAGLPVLKRRRADGSAALEVLDRFAASDEADLFEGVVRPRVADSELKFALLGTSLNGLDKRSAVEEIGEL